MEIKVLGTGCTNCKTLEKRTLRAVEEFNIGAQVEKVEDISKILSYGIMTTPALVINGRVVLAGRVPPVEEIAEIIRKYQ